MQAVVQHLHAMPPDQHSDDSSDIGRREAELNARLMQMASAIAHFGGWTFDRAQGRVIWSDEVCRIHEVLAGTTPTVEDAIGYFAPESRGKLRRLVETCLRDGTR
jgi:hypothetical protein